MCYVCMFMRMIKRRKGDRDVDRQPKCESTELTLVSVRLYGHVSECVSVCVRVGESIECVKTGGCRSCAAACV